MKTYEFTTTNYRITSKRWNRTMIVRACGRAMCLNTFVATFGLKGLERLMKYTNFSCDDNLRVRISGVSVYVHFK